MANDLIRERGRGPELVGTRITVYNLLPYFLDPSVSEHDICQLYGLIPEQVAAARAYILNNPDTVLAEHLKIEARISAGNPPEVTEKAKRTHALFLKFKEWIAERQKEDAKEDADLSAKSGEVENGFPSFKQWLADREAQPSRGS